MKFRARQIDLGKVVAEDTVEAADYAEAFKITHPEKADPTIQCTARGAAAWVELTPVDE